MDKVWRNKSNIRFLQTADIDLVNYYLNEAGAVNNEIKYVRVFRNHPNLFGEIRKNFLKTI